MNIAVLNDLELPKQLGKKGTTSDISIYNRKIGESVYAFISPIAYPEKLSPLLQSIYLADCAILIISELTPQVGEIILALDAFGVEKGFLISPLPYEQLRPMLKGTAVENYVPIEKSEALEKVKALTVKEEGGKSKCVIDHFFITKSGIVVLGLVKSGKIKVHDKLVLLPLKKEVQVRSIERLEESLTEAAAGDRIGMGIKGVELEDLSRGCMLVEEQHENIVSKEFEAELQMNSFFKEPLKVGQRCHIAVGLQFVPVYVKEIEGKEELKGEKGRVRFETEGGKLLAYERGEKFVITRPEFKGLKILGKGRVL